MNKEEIKAEDIGKLISDNISSAGTPIYGITGATKAIFDYIKNHSVPPHKEETKTLPDEILALDTPWPLIDVLRKLIHATDVLLHEKAYDKAGWEEIEHCFQRGKKTIELLDKYQRSVIYKTPLKPLSDEEIEKVSAKYATDSETKEFDNNACHDFQNGAKWARNNFSLSVDNTVSECKECMNYRGEVEILENENSNHIMAKESSDNIIFELSEQLESEKRTNKYNQELMTDANNKLDEVIKENESLTSQLNLYKESKYILTEHFNLLNDYMVIHQKRVGLSNHANTPIWTIYKEFLNTLKQK